MNLLKKILSPSAVETVEVTLTRNCQIKLATGKFTGGEIGKTYCLNLGDARELEASGSCSIAGAAERVAEHQAEIESWLPAPTPAEPVPGSWLNLPECFAQWWVKREVFRCLRIQYAETELELLAGISELIVPTASQAASDYGQRFRIVDQFIKGEFSSVASGMALFHEGEENLRRRNIITDRLNELARKIDDLTSREGDNLLRLSVDCGDHLVATHQELIDTSGELNKTALELFAQRVEPLGLSELKIIQLFQGGADAVKYHTVQPSLPHMKNAGFIDNAGNPRSYFGGSPIQAVSYLGNFTGELERLKPLLKEAKAALARASKAAA